MSKPTSSPYFIERGTLPPDAPSYIEREADTSLKDSLRKGEYCYVLVSRQMGKSSLMVRTIRLLQEEGIASVIIDLNAIGIDLTHEQWYGSMMTRIAERLKLQAELEAFKAACGDLSPLQKWLSFLEQVIVLLSPGRLVIFIDEIEQTKQLPFSTDEFFIGIRSCYNRRAIEEMFSKLTFCLLGSSLPSDLIRAPRVTPFNIAVRIQLTDFTLEQVLGWKAGFEGDCRNIKALLKHVYYWTNGHPYLTQSLCLAIAEDKTIKTRANLRALCRWRFLSADAQEQNDHLSTVPKPLFNSDVDIESLLDLYGKVFSRKRIAAQKRNVLVDVLLLSGIVRAHEGRLIVRNRIYERVFDRAWIRAKTTDEERKRQTVAARKAACWTGLAAAIILAIIGGLAISAHNSNVVSRRLAYSSYMHRIEQAWSAIPLDVDQVEALLDLTKDDPSRDWEWTYWEGHARAYREKSVGHTGPVYAVAFNNDHTLLVTGSYDKTAKIWDTETGEYKQTLNVNGGPVYAVAFAHKQNLVATGSGNGICQIWDVSPKKLWETVPHTAQIYTMAFSPDDTWLATGSVDGQVVLWNPKTGVKKILKGHTGTVHSVAFSPDGHLLVSAGYDGTARVWDLRAEKPKVTILRSKDGLVYTVAFSPDGETIVMGNRDGNISQWNVEKGVQYGTLNGHSETVSATAFLPNGDLLTASRDGTALIWKAGSPETPKLLNVEQGSLYAVTVSQDGARLATAGYDHKARIWDAAGNLMLILDGRKQIDQPMSNSLASKRERLTADDHSTVPSDPITGPYLLPLMIDHHKAKVHVSAFSDDGTRVIAASPDGTGAIFNMQNRQILTRLQGNPGTGFAAAFSHDGERVITVSPGGRAFIWEVKSGKQLEELKREIPVTDAAPWSLFVAAFSNDNNKVIIGSIDGWLMLYDSNKGILLNRQQPYTRAVATVAFSPNDQQVIIGSYDGKEKVKVLDSDTLALQFELDTGDISRDTSTKGNPVHESVNDIAFSKNGQKVAVATTGGTLQIWDIKNRVLLQNWKNYYGSTFTVGFEKEGHRVVTGSSDGTVIIFDSDSGQPLLTFRTGGMPIGYVAFSANSDRVVAGSYGGKVGTWECNPH